MHSSAKNVASFLTPKHEVMWLPAEITIEEALERMQVHRHVAVPILDGQGHYVGTLTNGDILRHLHRSFRANGGELAAALGTPMRKMKKLMAESTRFALFSVGEGLSWYRRHGRLPRPNPFGLSFGQSNPRSTMGLRSASRATPQTPARPCLVRG